MKYDRPVWQIMHACADGMPAVFRYEDVRNWFDTHYPEVNEATIRAHLIGLTEGGRAKHVQFAPRSPVFRRVARGEYEPIPLAERGEDPDVVVPSASKIKMSGNGAHTVDQAPADDTPRPAPVTYAGPAVKKPAVAAKKATGTPPKKPGVAKSGRQKVTAAAPAVSEPDEPGEPETQIPDVILLGSLGDRVNVPAPSKEVFREVSFQLGRLDAELTGSEWFVLSAEHGLVAPNEWMSPDSRTLADMEPSYRVTWASWVVARLQSLVGSLDGLCVRVDAPDAFIGPLFADLQDAGAVVTTGGVARSNAGADRDNAVAGQSDEATNDEVAVDRTPAHDVPVVTPTKVATVTEAATVSPVSVHLSDERNAVPASDVSSLPETPGLYAWFVDPIGARELNRCLMLPVRAGLVFVGQVGGSSWHSLADPVLNVRDHVERIQLHGRSRASTFRMTLATVLREHLRMTSLEDPALTEWMLDHLSVSAWASDDLGGLRECEQLVVTELDPPLNVDHLPATAYRARLSQMRSALA